MQILRLRRLSKLGHDPSISGASIQCQYLFDYTPVVLFVVCESSDSIHLLWTLGAITTVLLPFSFTSFRPRGSSERLSLEVCWDHSSTGARGGTGWGFPGLGWGCRRADKQSVWTIATVGEVGWINPGVLWREKADPCTRTEEQVGSAGGEGNGAVEGSWRGR